MKRWIAIGLRMLADHLDPQLIYKPNDAAAAMEAFRKGFAEPIGSRY